MNKHPVVVLGDIMLDQYHFGEVKRLNPEAPSPLLNVSYSENRLGGASNVAANLAAMGSITHLIGNVGNDVHGKVVEELCRKNNIQLTALLTQEPTITKMRFIEQTYNQQILRSDFEEKITLTDLQNKCAIEQLYALAPEYVVIADYNKGVLNDALINELNTLNIKILLDTKSYKIQQFKNIFLLKPNFKEFKEIVGKDIDNTDSSIEAHGKELAYRLNCNIVITRGKEGASLITPQGEYLHLTTVAHQVFDVSGAGDTFSAGVITGLMRGMDLPDAVMLGNKASGIAVSKIGTTVVGKDELFAS